MGRLSRAGFGEFANGGNFVRIRIRGIIGFSGFYQLVFARRDFVRIRIFRISLSHNPRVSL